MAAFGFSVHMLNPDWDAMNFMTFCRSMDVPSLPPQCFTLISKLFFPFGIDRPIDVSEHSKYKYAQELRELLPAECRKGNLTFDDVESAFLRLALAYARRTTRLQQYGNRMFRHALAHEVFRTKALPEHLFAYSKSDYAEVQSWNDGPVLGLVVEQECTESPGDGLLLRTATTSAEVLARPLSSEVLEWEDETTKLCHFLLLQLFELPDFLHEGATVSLQGLKGAAWLNGAEGTLGGLHPSGRYNVDLHFPQSAVKMAIANDKLGRPRVLISPHNILRWPGDSDTFSLRMIQDKAAWQPEAQILLQKFLPFISLFSGSNPDTQISMADMVSRIKQVSHLTCWIENGFREPVNAYLKRKLRHVMLKVQKDLSPPCPISISPTEPEAALTIVNGGDYYVSVGEISECGSLIYFPAKVVSFNVSFRLITALVDTPADSGKVFRLLLKVNLAMVSTAFVPKSDFEKRPRGIVCKYLTDECNDYSPPPSDWSAYEENMRDILTRIAAGCGQFRMGPSMLPDIGRTSPFSMSNGVSSLQFTQIDFGVSFQPFFSEKITSLSAQEREAFLQMPALREDNRCFFIHLGVALGFHPVALQAIFRAHSDAMLRRIELALSQKTHEDDQRFDEVKLLEGSLQSVLRKNDMIEAPILSIVWPQEFQELQNVRILIFTVGRSGPQPNSCYLFCPRTTADDADSFDGIDVILKLQGMHFTLLRPLDEHSSHSPIDRILDLFPDIVEIQPLHLQASDAGSIVREVGRVQSLADLHRTHSPAAAAPAVPASAPASAPHNPDEIEPYD